MHSFFFGFGFCIPPGTASRNREIPKVRTQIRLLFCRRYRARTIVHARRTTGIFNRHGVETPRAPFEEWIRNDKPALTASTCFGLKARLKTQCIGIDIGFHIRICERIPPTRNAPTHVPNQTIMASFAPRSLSITINDAMQGTNRVIVTSATTI